jgi:hypothetical protein
MSKNKLNHNVYLFNIKYNITLVIFMKRVKGGLKKN